MTKVDEPDKAVRLAMSELERTVGPLAWSAGWQPFSDQDDITKAVELIHKAMKRLKKVMDRQAERNKLVACRECQEEFTHQDCPDGVCDECNREECPTCEGTGMDPDPDYDDEEMNSDCPDCCGDGRV